MKLKPFVAGPGFADRFERLMDWQPEQRESAGMMLALVRHLEGVDAPECWANTGSLRGELLLFLDARISVAISAHPRPAPDRSFYEVRYALPAPWSYATGFAEGVEAAAGLVLDALKYADPESLGLYRRRQSARPEEVAEIAP